MGAAAVSRLRILLADDHFATLCAVRSFLESDYNVVGAVGDGQSVVEANKNLSPDVAVIDISMPGMSGLEAAKRMREMGSTTRIVFLTLHGDPDCLQAAMLTGALGYVLKYRMATDLPIAIDSALAGRRFVSPPLSDLLI